jgi:hypothetical protein
MQLLSDLLAATTTTTGGDGGGGFDPWKTVGIPSAVVAVFTLVTTYAFGFIRPLVVKLPRYWHVGQATRFSCSVRNRSYSADRTITSMTLFNAPRWLKRTFWPRWKRDPQVAEFIPWGLPAPLPTLSKRNEETLEGELRQGDVSGVYDPGPRCRLLVHAGSRSSRSKRLKKLNG